MDEHRIHHILAHSYSVYFVLLLVGIALDVILKLQLFEATLMPIGVIVLVLATLLILWAQNTSRNLEKENLTKENFCRGPYCYTRSPTHWGLFLLILGFGIIANAFFVVVFNFVSFIITRLTLVKKQEEALALKYGSPYLEYKKMVKF